MQNGAKRCDTEITISQPDLADLWSLINSMIWLSFLGGMERELTRGPWRIQQAGGQYLLSFTGRETKLSGRYGYKARH